MKRILFFTLLFIAIGILTAQTSFTATYTFGTNGNVASFTYNGTTYAGLTMGTIDKVGVTTSSSNSNFRANGWSTGAIDTDKYIGFTMTAVSGYKFTVNTINFGIGRSGTGTRDSEWRGSSDSYAALINNYTTLNSGLTNNSGVLNNLDSNSNWSGNVLTLGSNYADVTTNCGFRCYLYNAEATSGTAGLAGAITISGTFQLDGGGANTPPTISSISQTPSTSITSSTTVSVSADVTDSDGTVEAVALNWGTSTGVYTNSIDMSIASGDTYTTDTNIPAQANNTTVYYVIEAMDDELDITTSGELTYTVNDPLPSAPTALAATAVSHEGFTARWDAVSGATSYRLDVLTGSSSELLNTGFEGSTSFPTGWTQNSSYVQSNSSIAHTDSYYAGMNAANDYFYTPVLASPATITFWTEASSNTANNTVKLQYSADENAWTDLATYVANGTNTGDITDTWSQKTVNANLTGNYYIRWLMSARSGGSAYFDDVVITSGSTTFVLGWNDTTVNANIARIDVLDPSTDYQYVVRAVNAIGTSSNSSTISVTTTATTAGDGANTVIGGASTVVLVAPLTGLSDNTVEIDPNTTSNDDFSVAVTSTSTVITYSITTSNNLALNGIYQLNHVGMNGAPTDVTVNMGTIDDVSYDASGTLIEISGISAKGTLIIYVEGNVTLPIELSSFTATINAQNYVNLMWITQSETGVSGYYVYRNSTDEIGQAALISPLITASNTSQQQSYIFTDDQLFNDGVYYYWLQNVDFDGSNGFHGPVLVNFSTGGTGGTPPIPQVTKLNNIFPNPFNPSAQISYSIKDAATVKIRIYNSRGQIVRSINNAPGTVGNHRIVWDGRTDNGSSCSTGLYFVRMFAGKDVFTQKAMLVK